ncbi:MAG TPA: MoaD/ThiS family protein [Dehalococcoidia bacterium]|nr:MoaD/ThiS family protein [Dehalococcoidia bacterium]
MNRKLAAAREQGGRAHASPDRRTRYLVIAAPIAMATAVGAAFTAPQVLAGQHAGNTVPGEVQVPAERTSGRDLGPETVNVHVRLGASLKMLLGVPALRVSLPNGATVNTLLNSLGNAYPAVDVMGPSVLVAVDGEAVQPHVTLADGQVVELVMQMAGG